MDKNKMIEISVSIRGSKEILEELDIEKACVTPETHCTGTGSKEVESTSPATARKMHKETNEKRY